MATAPSGTPESRGYESLSIAGFLLANSTRLRVGSSIASIYARDAFTARRGMLTLNALYGDRFILGLGVSHVPTVEGVRGHVYEKPIPAMRHYLDGIMKDQPSAEEWPIMIAALGPKMLALTAERARGALPYNVTPRAHGQGRQGPRAVQGPGGRAESLRRDRPRRVPRARSQGAGALPDAAELPQQLAAARLLRDGTRRWRQRPLHRRDGAARRRRHRQEGPAHAFRRGATHVCIQPVHAEGDWAARDRMLAALADT
ncbi:MAG: LLM class flavin-dependent oxidoreductase [Acetobacteraceae bacterium]